MRKTFVIFLLTLLFPITVEFLSRSYAMPPVVKTAPKEQNAVASARVAPPKRIIIPRLSVDTFIEHVGLDSNGNMDIPRNVNNVAWYSLSARPGELGSAVIAGHLDTVTGDPSVFYYLAYLEENDEIYIEDYSGSMHVFSVVGRQIYNVDAMPLSFVFSNTDASRLNLITCAGAYDAYKQGYQERTVVYALKTSGF